MNICALVGRLSTEPTLKYTPNGVATCTFNLAVEDPFAKQEPKADFINIVAWKQTAESCAEYLNKGHRCSVEGRIKTRKYEKDGRTVYVTEVIASNVRFLEPKQKNDNQEPKHTDYSNGPSINDDDLPF